LSLLPFLGLARPTTGGQRALRTLPEDHNKHSSKWYNFWGEPPSTHGIMKIYFAGSIRGGRDDAALYCRIIALLSAYGQVLTEHVGSEDLPPGGEKDLADGDIYARDMAWLTEADVVVAEVTTPSHGVGYEIGQAEAMGKPVLCLHRPGTGWQLSAMLAGNPKLQCEAYESLEELKPILARFLSAA
jgi:nucleoside 2-deoxyribosyltransferase